MRRSRVETESRLTARELKEDVMSSCSSPAGKEIAGRQGLRPGGYARVNETRARGAVVGFWLPPAGSTVMPAPSAVRAWPSSTTVAAPLVRNPAGVIERSGRCSHSSYTWEPGSALRPRAMTTARPTDPDRYQVSDPPPATALWMTWTSAADITWLTVETLT